MLLSHISYCAWIELHSVDSEKSQIYHHLCVCCFFFYSLKKDISFATHMPLELGEVRRRLWVLTQQILLKPFNKICCVIKALGIFNLLFLLTMT